MISRFSIFALALLALWLAGCQTSPTTTTPPYPPYPPTPLPTPTDALGDPKALTLAPPSAPRADDLLPLKPHQGVYRFFDGDQAGLDVPFSFSPDPDKPLLWRQELTGQTITWFQKSSDGSMAIVREDDLQEEVTVEYEPALVVLPANLSEAPLRGTSRMTVRDLDDGRFKTAGPCEYEVKYLGVQKLGTWAGTIEVHLVQVNRQIRLPIAKVNVQVITAYQTQSHGMDGQGIGQVAERVIQTTQALGFFGSQEISETRLLHGKK